MCCCLDLGFGLEIPEGRVSFDLDLWLWFDLAEADLGRRLFLPIFSEGERAIGWLGRRYTVGLWQDIWREI